MHSACIALSRINDRLDFQSGLLFAKHGIAIKELASRDNERINTPVATVISRFERKSVMPHKKPDWALRKSHFVYGAMRSHDQFLRYGYPGIQASRTNKERYCRN
jgi:hypothetical protein